MKKLLFGLTGLLLSLSTFATDYYVNSTAPAGGDGLSWATAVRGIADLSGINGFVITNGDRVYFGQGAYSVPFATGYALVSGAKYYGGYNYNQTTGVATRDINATPTFFVNNPIYPYATTINISHALTNQTLMDGIVIRTSLGAGMVCNGNGSIFYQGEVIAPVFKDCVFDGQGVAVMLGRNSEYITPTFSNCTFKSVKIAVRTQFGPTANGFLGNIISTLVKPVFENTVFTNITQHALSIVNHAGGKFEPQFKKCTFRKINQYPIYHESNISQNLLVNGIISQNFKFSPYYEQCLFYWNNGILLTRDDIGGDHDISHKFNNCTFFSNQSHYPGQVYDGYSFFSKTDNTTNLSNTNSVHHARFNNCILWGSWANPSRPNFFLGTAVKYAFNHSLIEVTTKFDTDPSVNCQDLIPTIKRMEYINGAGNMLFNVDPIFTNPTLFGPLPDLHPMPSSPVINAGDNTVLGTTVPTDLDGQARTVNTIDMGAYEYCPGGPIGCAVVVSPGPTGPTFPQAGSPVTAKIGGSTTLYPNPATTHVSVRTTGDDVVRYLQVIDMSGNVVAGARSGSVNISDLAKGSYLVQIHFVDRTETERLIKR